MGYFLRLVENRRDVPLVFSLSTFRSYQVFVETMNDKITSAPITLPKVYGNDSLKSKHNIYVAAHFAGDKLPSNFILGDNKWYEFHFNKKLKPLTKYRIYIRALAKDRLSKVRSVFI